MYNNFLLNISNNLNYYEENLKKGIELNEVELILPISEPELYHIIIYKVEQLNESIVTYEKFKREILKIFNLTVTIFFEKIVFRFNREFSLAIEFQKQGIKIYIRCDSIIIDPENKLKKGGVRSKYMYHIYNNDEESYTYFFETILSNLVKKEIIVTEYYKDILNILFS